MSLLKRLQAKLSPEAQIKEYIKSKIPQAKESMEEFLDQLFLQIAEDKKENPFELFLVISNKADKVLGVVYNPKKKKLASIDVGDLAEKVLLDQLDGMPSFLKEAINNGLENLDLSISELFAKELSGKCLVAKYNKNSELIFIEIDGNKKQIVNLEKIISNLDL